MTDGIVLTGLVSLLDTYLFRGAASRLAVDVIKGAYGKLRHRSWEDLYLDAFRKALDDSAEVLHRYAAADGEIELLVKQFKDALTCDLGVDAAKLSEATLTSDKFGRLLAAALAQRQALVIGGHNLSQHDYAQIVGRLVERAQSIFRTEVQGNPVAFQQSVLGASRETLERDRKTQASAEEIERLVVQVDAFLRDRVDLVLTKLDEIHMDVKDTKEAVGRLSSPTAPTALNYLPPPPDDFVGRGRETQKLLAALRSGGATISGAAKAGVSGMPGVGKTALALYVAHQVAGEYETHIYLDLKGTANPPPTPTDAMVSVVRAFDLSLDTTRLTADDIKRLYFSRLHGTRALLLLDNAADAGQVEPLLPGRGCAVLVTSRRAFVLAGLKPLPLGVLPPGKARALLLKICPRIGAAATDLAELCGRLPLVLRLAASHLAERQDLLVNEYVESLRERRTRLAALKSEGHSDWDVEAAFEVSYDWQGDPDQARWRALAVFPAPFDAAAAAAVWGLDEPAARALLAESVRVSMVEYDEAGGRYHLHDLLAAFAEARLSPNESYDAHSRHAWHFIGVIAEADALYLRGGRDMQAGLCLFDAEWPHIHAGQAWAATNADHDDEAAAMARRFPLAGAHCLDLRLPPGERVAWYETAVASARRLGVRFCEGAALGNLGTSYLDNGQAAKTIAYCQQALVISREVYDRALEGGALATMGNAFLAQGQAAKAVEYHQQARCVAREIGDRRLEGACLSGMGNAYRDLGRVTEAVEYYQQALVISQVLGDRDGEGCVLGSMGNALAILMRADEAMKCYLQVLPIAREIGDPDMEGIALGNLGNASRYWRQMAQAERYYRDALAIIRERGSVVRTCWILRALGDLLSPQAGAAAEEVYREALALAPEDQRNYEGISLLLRQQGREGEVVLLLLKRAALAPENPSPVLALASIYRQIGEQALSAEHAARARGLLKPDDRYDLACLESVCGNADAALDHLRRAAGEPDFDAASAWADLDLQWIRDDPRFAEIVGPKPRPAQGDA